MRNTLLPPLSCVARLFCIVGLVLALPFGAAMAQTQSGFLSGIPDLPLMSKLKEVPDSGMVFDKPEGRIVTAVATGPVEVAEVSDFYAATLPQLGWQPGPVGSYLRDGEKLSLAIEEAEGGVTVQFTLAPQ
jgi:hypothetical protein